MLHFRDDIVSNFDRLRRIRNIIGKLRGTFASTFYSYRNLCIEKRLFLYIDKLVFKNSLHRKEIRFDMKSFFLCACKTGYIQDFIIYMGPGIKIEPKHKDVGKSWSVVMSLLELHFGKGHALYVDNWYISSALFSILHKNSTNACITVYTPWENRTFTTSVETVHRRIVIKIAMSTDKLHVH